MKKELENQQNQISEKKVEDWERALVALRKMSEKLGLNSKSKIEVIQNG